MAKRKKGQIGNLPNTIMTIAIISVIAVVVSIVHDKLDDGLALTTTQGMLIGNMTANSTAFLNNVTGQLPLLGTIIIMGVVISSIITYFWKKAG